MWKDIFKQMFPFILLLAVLWITAEVLDRTLGSGATILAPPEYNTSPAAQP